MQGIREMSNLSCISPINNTSHAALKTDVDVQVAQGRYLKCQANITAVVDTGGVSHEHV